MNDTHDLTLRDTAKGIAVRAGILSVASLVIGAWVFSLAAKAASGLVKLFVGTILLGIGTGVVTWEVKKVQRHLHGRTQPQPLL
jgi:ascorbate-specific PTS system EIIC-type component UlaA